MAGNPDQQASSLTHSLTRLDPPRILGGPEMLRVARKGHQALELVQHSRALDGLQDHPEPILSGTRNTAARLKIRGLYRIVLSRTHKYSCARDLYRHHLRCVANSMKLSRACAHSKPPWARGLESSEPCQIVRL